MSVRNVTVNGLEERGISPKRDLAGAETGSNRAVASLILYLTISLFLIVIIYLRYHVGCYLDRMVLSQLQSVQTRRQSLKVGVLGF
jgi:hypothetical protein